jgi:uncharacterized protein
LEECAMKKTMIIAAAVALTFAAQSIKAQEPAKTKSDLVRELLAVTDFRNTALSTVDTMITELDKQYPRIFEGIIDQDPDLTPSQRQKIKEGFGESMPRFSALLRKRIRQRIDLGQLMEEIALPLYAKYFSEDELRDLISFYKTPTGQKTLSVLPQLFGDSVREASQKLGPPLTNIVMEVLAEEKDRLKKNK